MRFYHSRRSHRWRGRGPSEPEPEPEVEGAAGAGGRSGGCHRSSKWEEPPELEVGAPPEPEVEGQLKVGKSAARARGRRVGPQARRRRERSCSGVQRYFSICLDDTSCRVRLSCSVRKHKNINGGHVSTWHPI
jgi:hypothetical protein